MTLAILSFQQSEPQRLSFRDFLTSVEDFCEKNINEFRWLLGAVHTLKQKKMDFLRKKNIIISKTNRNQIELTGNIRSDCLKFQAMLVNLGVEPEETESNVIYDVSRFDIPKEVPSKWKALSVDQKLNMVAVSLLEYVKRNPKADIQKIFDDFTINIRTIKNIKIVDGMIDPSYEFETWYDQI